MRWLLGGILVILAVLTIAVGALIYLVPSTAIERHILTAVSRATATDIKSTGTPEITLFPSIELVLRGVEARPQSAAGPILKAREIEAEVSWLSLLTGWTVDVIELRIIAPELLFQPSTVQNLEAAPALLLRKPSYPLPGVAIRKATIERGRVTGLGPSWRIKDVDAEMKLADIDNPLDIDFNLFLNGHRVVGAMNLNNPSRLVTGGRIPLTARVSADLGSAEFDGAWRSAESILVANIKANTMDIDSAARWLEFGPVPEFAGKPAALDGSVRVGADGILFKDAAVTVDELKARIAGRIQQDGDSFVARDFTVTDVDPQSFGVPAHINLTALRAHFDRIEPGSPVAAELAFDLNGQRVTGRATVPDLDQLQPGESFPLKWHVTVPGGGALEFDGEAALPVASGTLEQAAGWSAAGKLRLKTDSMREAASWLKFSLPQTDAYNAAEFNADVTFDGQSIKFAGANASFDATQATGDLMIDLAGERTSVKGAFNLDSIDTERYLGAGLSGAAAAAVRPDQLEGLPAASPPYEITLLPLKPSLEAVLAGGSGSQLEALGPVPVLTSDWSGTSLGVGSLRDLDSDIDLDLSVGDLRHGSIELGRTSMTATLDKGIFMLDVKESRPLQGEISGTVRIDARPESPTFNLVLDANGIVVEQLIRQVGQRDVIRGTLTGQAKLLASGNTEADVIRTMTGEVRGQVRDGAIVGYNVRKLIWPSTSRQYNPSSATPFSSLKADFTITDGVASSPGILLDGPTVRIRADGKANLSTSKIDYRTDLTVFPPPAKLSFPLKVLGTWRKLKADLDWLRLATEWSGPSPFPNLERTARRRSKKRTAIGDKELKALVDELITKNGGKTLPPRGAALLRQLTGNGR